MLCAVCESESFTQDDTGFYICDACGTQSQDFRQEVSEVDINELGTYRRSRRFAAPVAQQSSMLTLFKSVHINDFKFFFIFELIFFFFLFI